MVLKISRENLYNSYPENMLNTPVVRDNVTVVLIPMVKDNDEYSNKCYQADLQVNVMDQINKYIFDATPKIEIQEETITPFKWIPEDYLKMGDSKCFCSTDNEIAYNNLPRTIDGEFDEEKIKLSLQKAIRMIKSQNASALECLNYGVYKEAINSTNLLNGLLGPELALVIEKAAAAQGCELPDFVTADISLFEVLTAIGEVADSSIFESFGTNLIEDLSEVKSIDAIKNDIEKQNALLDELINFNIENDEDVKRFLNAYLNITGTSFSCEKIDECYALQNDENSARDKKLVAYASSCGLSANFVNAKKNEILTNVVYDAALRYVIPSIIGKIQHPIAKCIAAALPTYIAMAETATEGCAEGDMINKSNLTYKNFINIVAEGGVRGFLVLLPSSSWGGKIFSHSNFMKNLFSPEKGSVFNNLFVRLFGSKPLKAAGNFSAEWLLSRCTELIIPDVTAKDGIIRMISPQYNFFKTVDGWIY